MKHDLQRFAKQACHRTDWGSILVRCYARSRRLIPAPLAGGVEHLYQWFLTPMTLWPCNLHGFLKSNLYGMEKGKPLLQKLSVNLTPFDTMIFIPACWSFDYHPDLRSISGSLSRALTSSNSHPVASLLTLPTFA